MPQAHIRLGDPVFSRDGRKLGTVDRLILDERRHQVKALVVHKLLRAADKIIEMSQVERVGEDGIVLRMTADEAAQLSAFVRQEFVDVTPESALHPFYPSLAPGAGSFLAAAPAAGTHTIEDAMADVHPPPIPPDATVSVESNVPVDYDVISRGTDVFSADGHRVGTVVEVPIDPDGNVTGFVVKEGVLFKHDVFIPVDWIADVGDKHIRLKVTAEQAEASPQRARGARVTPATASGS